MIFGGCRRRALIAFLAVVIVPGGSAEAAKRLPSLTATTTLPSGESFKGGMRLDELHPGDFDVVRRSRSSVTLGYPAKVRRGSPRYRGRRCSLITYRLRLFAGHVDPLQRARELVPVATAEGTSARDASSGPESRLETDRGWRLLTEIRNGVLTERGVAVQNFGDRFFEGGPAARFELSLRGRQIHEGGACGGGGKTFYTLGPRVLLPLTR